MKLERIKLESSSRSWTVFDNIILHRKISNFDKFSTSNFPTSRFFPTDLSDYMHPLSNILSLLLNNNFFNESKKNVFIVLILFPNVFIFSNGFERSNTLSQKLSLLMITWSLPPSKSFQALCDGIHV